jgi:hypothetical protein
MGTHDLANVVDANVPLESWSFEDVSVAACGVVPLKDKYPFARVFCQQGCGRQSPDPGADDDDVEGPFLWADSQFVGFSRELA